jgi:hypothetical protein
MTIFKQSPKLMLRSAYPLAFVAGFILSFFPAYGHTQNEGRWYDVEILVFKRLDQDSQSQELWRSDLTLAYPHFYEYLRGPSPEAKSQLSALKSDRYVLRRYRDALARSEKFRILAHKAWSQQMANEAQSPAIIIDGGEEIGNHRELEGYIKVHIARFLHVTSNLWLTDIDANSVDASIKKPTLPAEPSRAKAGILKLTNTSAIKTRQIDDNDRLLNDINNEFSADYNSPYPIITLQSKTKMRSNELHYVDHPAMGIMIFMTPIDDT